MSWKDAETSKPPIKGVVLPEQTDTACIHPWEWYSIDTGFGMYRICPRHSYQPIESGKIQFNNHAPLQELRKALVNGEKHPGCNDCWLSEEAGGKSYRKQFGSDVWPRRGVNAIKKQAPKWVEIKFSNLCNIKCLTCFPVCSSLWEEDIGFSDSILSSMNRDIDPKETNRQFFKWIKENYNDIDCFQLFGGEPVLHPDFYPLLDLILDAPESAEKKQISYSTNGHWPLKYKEKHYEYLDRLFKAGHTVFVRFSIDGVGARGEYVRDNLNWDNFEKNFKEFYNTWYGHPQINRMRCNVALSVLNVLYLDEICQWLHENTPGVIPHYNFVSVPGKFYMMNWGTMLKPMQKLISMQDFKQYTVYQEHVIDLCNSYSNLAPNVTEIIELKKTLDLYDQKKGVNHFDLFPRNALLFEGIEQ